MIALKVGEAVAAVATGPNCDVGGGASEVSFVSDTGLALCCGDLFIAVAIEELDIIVAVPVGTEPALAVGIILLVDALPLDTAADGFWKCVGNGDGMALTTGDVLPAPNLLCWWAAVGAVVEVLAFAGNNEMEGVGTCLAPTVGATLPPPLPAAFEMAAGPDVVTGVLLTVFLVACCAATPPEPPEPTLPATGVI